MLTNTRIKNDAFEINSPYDGSLIAKVDAADEFAVEHALSSAAILFRDREQWLSREKRLEVFNKTISIMIDQVDEFSLLITQESGKPLAYSREETIHSIEIIKLYVDILKHESFQEEYETASNPVKDFKILSQYDPIGIVVVISSFFEPLRSVVEQIVPAIASGCPVIIKPSEETPLSCFKFIKLLRQSGLPEDWCQSLAINRLDVVTQLVTDERVSLFSFIGDAKNGWMFHSRLAPGTRSILEHGSTTPVIVTNNANQEKAIPTITRAAFINAGQSNISIQRVFVPVAIAREFAQSIAEVSETYTVGDPLLEQTGIGPLINKVEVDRVDQWVKEAIDMGAELICGGQTVGHSFYANTVLFNSPLQATVSQHEIYGPVVCVYPYNDLQNAIELANNSSYAFYAGIFSEDEDEVAYISQRLNASSILVNNYEDIRTNGMSYEGLKQSGLGIRGIPQTMSNMKFEKKCYYQHNNPVKENTDAN